MIVMLFILTACGKPDTDKKQPTKTEKADNQEDSAGDVDGADSFEAKDEDSQSTVETPNDDNASVVQEPSDNMEPNTGSNNDTTTKPSTNNSNTTSGSTNSGNTSNSGNSGSNTQKPSNNSSNTGGLNNSGSVNNSGNTGGSSTTTTKKPVKRVSEEVKSAVVPYKYGITKYDVTTNYYTLYSDGSKELLDSDSYPVYDSSNYSAADGQLKSEADSNALKYMSYYQEVLRLVNEIRVEAGVAPLTLDTTLCKAASMRALEMDYGNEVSHTRPNGSTCWTVLDFYGASYGTCGENIAAGQTSASSVVRDWKNSPGHYQNMINASFTKLGVGYSTTGVGDYGHYWCQLFTN